jgi:hypothetical protein
MHSRCDPRLLLNQCEAASCSKQSKAPTLALLERLQDENAAAARKPLGKLADRAPITWLGNDQPLVWRGLAAEHGPSYSAAR